jgi:hypothetical protein
MGAGSFFRKRNDRAKVPDQSTLRDRITFAIRTYLRVRGLDTLLHRDSQLVVRKNFDIFVMSGADNLEDPTSVVGLFRLQDVESFAEFSKVQTDPLLRSGALGKMTLGHLADQLADLVIERCHSSAGPSDSVSAAPAQDDVVGLALPATAETK